MMNVTYDHENNSAPRQNEKDPIKTRETFVKKHKPVAQKIRPVYQDLHQNYTLHGFDKLSLKIWALHFQYTGLWLSLERALSFCCAEQ